MGTAAPTTNAISNRISQVQRLFDKKILRDWNEELLTSQEQSNDKQLTVHTRPPFSFTFCFLPPVNSGGAVGWGPWAARRCRRRCRRCSAQRVCCSAVVPTRRCSGSCQHWWRISRTISSGTDRWYTKIPPPATRPAASPRWRKNLWAASRGAAVPLSAGCCPTVSG